MLTWAQVGSAPRSSDGQQQIEPTAHLHTGHRGADGERAICHKPYLDEITACACALSRNPALLTQENKTTAEGASVRRTPIARRPAAGRAHSAPAHAPRVPWVGGERPTRREP